MSAWQRVTRHPTGAGNTLLAKGLREATEKGFWPRRPRTEPPAGAAGSLPLMWQWVSRAPAGWLLLGSGPQAASRPRPRFSPCAGVLPTRWSGGSS